MDGRAHAGLSRTALAAGDRRAETPGGCAATPASVTGALQWRAAVEGCDHDPRADRALAGFGAVALAATSPLLFVGHASLSEGRAGAALQPGGVAVSPRAAPFARGAQRAAG